MNGPAYRHRFIFSGLLGKRGTKHLDLLLLSPTLQQLLSRTKLKKSASDYPAELRTFACTLQFYSTRAYEYVRRSFAKALPHVSTIRKWFANLDGGPGFCAHAFSLLKRRVHDEREKGCEVLLAVILDDMAIKKKVEYNSKTSEFVGYINIGSGKY